MLFHKISFPALAFTAILGLSACGVDVGANGDVAVSGPDATEATCERFNEVNGTFHDMDLQALDSDELLMHFNEGVEELVMVSNDAENGQLAASITTMTDALRTAVESANGELESIDAQFEEQLQGVGVQDAAAHIDEICDARMNL